MEYLKSGKSLRILGLYTKLINGHAINKAEEAQNYCVDEHSIERDIHEIRNFLENDAVNAGFTNSVIYEQESNRYRLEQMCKIQKL